MRNNKIHMFFGYFILLFCLLLPINVFADSESAVCTYSRINLIKSDNFAFDTGDKAFPPIVQFGRKENGEVYVVFPNGSNDGYEKEASKTFWKYYDSHNGCPEFLSVAAFAPAAWFEFLVDIIFFNPLTQLVSTSGFGIFIGDDFYNSVANGSVEEPPSGIGVAKYKISFQETPNIEKPDINSCEQLFTPDILSIIDEILNVVKVIAPILVLVLGIIDFAQAIFSDNDDSLKKAQGKFVKRLLVAVLLFLLPIFVNFLLTVINGVISGNWSTCGIG